MTDKFWKTPPEIYMKLNREETMRRWQWFFKRKPPYLWEDRPIVRQKAQRKYDIRFIWFAWAITVILALGFDIYVGHKVTAAYKDTELTRLSMQLDRANDELAFWQATLRRVVEGDQLTETIGGRPSEGD